MSKKIMKSLAIFGTLALVSIPMIAQPIQQKIEAMINPTVEYTLNGQDILDNTTTITYNNKNYVSVADLSHALGLDVKFVDGTVVLAEKAPTSRTTEVTTQNTEVVAPEFIEVVGATVVAIEDETNQITILPADMEDVPTNYIVLNVSEDTIVAEDLAVGSVVNVKHSPMMTRSLPPQTAASEITIASETTPVLPEVVAIESATIKEINLESGQVTVLPNGMEDDMMNYLVLNTSVENTVVRHEFNKRVYRIEDLEVGTKVAVKHAPLMTLSIPAQSPASEIVILANQE